MAFVGAANVVQKKDEVVEIVNETNQVLQPATREVMRAKNLLHRCSFVFVFNSKGDLFVQKRVSWKETYPGHYDPCPGGVVGAGESYEDNAIREIHEEMGVTGVSLESLFDFYFEDTVSRLWGRAFSCVYDGDIVLQQEEVESGSYMSLEDVKQLVASNPCCPDSLACFMQFLSHRAVTVPQADFES
mmetsp:Transcript_44436/g.85003  ORF Transcript_44436/g.85003 Transcript_44436/m.85003 type:complete len:187 (+) Transcript_44436:144-704(+)|eukprot:CAMPEP_0114234602 /NCGR_PEP_ID=MMETSP0058-20121206/5794_1 /TAXON_ID=36894 /ORGANISM="Pyramimonas parkeae, CCMP726" /LENGTH=186 /DNA_ID=CAMNT_0001346287 /DNA_START=90 /DNA_END=650 /DNA_ORIENTATION=-